MSDAFVGEIRPWAINFIPEGWLLCDGRTLPIAQNQALYSLLGNQYGPVTATTFVLPNLCGRVTIGYGTSSAGTTYIVGKASGTETVTLTTSNMPAHTHTMYADQTDAAGGLPNNNYLAKVQTAASGGTAISLYAAKGSNPTVPLSPTSIDSSGGGVPYPNMQPFLTMQYAICTIGVYPPRS